QRGDVGAPSRADVKGLDDVTQLVAGEAFTCALLSDGHVTCWGLVPGRNAVVGPTRIPGLEATKLAASSRSVCALRQSGVVACGGDNQQQSIVHGGPAYVATPTDITFRDYLQKAGKAQDLAMTDARVCAVMSAGEVICWGHSPWFSDEPS